MTDRIEQPDLWHPVRKQRQMADTSVAAYRVADSSGHLSRTEQIVYDTLTSFGRLTRHQLAAATGLPLSSVCGRVKALIDKGQVRDVTDGAKKLICDGRHVVEATAHQVHQQRRAG